MSTPKTPKTELSLRVTSCSPGEFPAKATIADQAKMVKSLEEAFAKRGSSGTPQVKITDTNDKVWTEGKDEMPTADELAEAFWARA